MTALKLIDFSPLYCDVEYTRKLLADARTATACNALRCNCLEWADGPMIAGYPSCHVCSHTKASHKPKSTARKVKR